MFHPWKTTLLEAGSPRSRRDRRRFVPTLSGSLSQLEDRVVLSAASHAAAVAHKAAALAGTHAGQVVTGLYESILATKPSETQLIKGVAEVRQGHEKALRNQLIKAAQKEHAPVAAKTTVTVSVSTAGSSKPITSFSTTFT
ncbi:MAG TPA: hypothetical protein VFF52_19760, partial [Isosphaeraceae bacterium]|nr:hypothetical protein [Isosphaeraceae bacterium]